MSSTGRIWCLYAAERIARLDFAETERAAVTGREIREYGWGNIPAWKDIIAILSDGYDVCGIRQDGALIYTDYEVKEIKKGGKKTFITQRSTVTVPLPEKVLPWKLF